MLNVKYDFSKIKRYFHNGISFLLKLDKVTGPPAHVHIETTNICNFRCVYCPQSRPEEHFRNIGRGRMTIGEFQRIVDKLIEKYKLEKIILTRDGEPLLHPDLEKFILYSRQKGIHTTLGSNGSMITLEKARLLIKNGLNSIKGDFCINKEEYESLRVGSVHEKTLQGYRNILQAAKEKNAGFILVLFDLHTYLLRDYEKIQESLEGLKSLFTGYERWLGVSNVLMHNALGESVKTLSTSKKALSGKKYNLCHHPWLEMVIDYKGNAVGCCRDLRSEYQAGNILKVNDIDKEIWNGEKMRYLRRSLRKKHPENISICGKCDLPYGVSYAGKTILGKIMRFMNKGKRMDILFP
jgi:radical SAM protein with 4Fe4S-binding SPASM domain